MKAFANASNSCDSIMNRTGQSPPSTARMHHSNRFYLRTVSHGCVAGPGLQGRARIDRKRLLQDPYGEALVLEVDHPIERMGTMPSAIITSVVLALLMMSSPTLAADTTRYEHGETVLSNSNGNRSYPYRILKPSNHNRTAPLVVFLHGAGERGDDNQRQLTYLPQRFLDAPHLNTRDCFVLAPQCPEDDTWAPFEIREGEPVEHTKAMQAAIITIRKIISQENIDTSRIYLTGLSMGGYGSQRWRLVIPTGSRPWYRFAAAGSRRFEAGRCPNLGIPWRSGSGRPRACQQRDGARHSEGGRQPRLHSAPGVGHGSWPWATNSRCDGLMFAQRNPDPRGLRQMSTETEINPEH